MNTRELIKIMKFFIENNPGPIYLSIPNALIDAINKGIVGEGDRLPPQRSLAKELGTDLTTITRSFSEARKQGLIEATVGRGTFIRIGASETRWKNTNQAVVDLTMNLPPIPENPSIKNLIQTELSSILRQQDLHALLSYRMTGGTADERKQACRWISPVIGHQNEDNILIVPGAQAAIAAIVTTLLKAGDIIVTDRFTYPGIRTVCAQFNIIIKGIDSDSEGMLPDQLEEACSRLQPRLIYCTPTIQNPTTSTMSIERRKKVISIARKNNAYILEDDPYSLLLKTPLPALAQLEPSRVFYVASLSKVISPSLRLAFMCAPDVEFSKRITAALRATTLTNSGLMTVLMTKWIEKGTATQILSAIREELSERQKIAKDILGDSHCTHPEGPHVWLKLPEWWSSIDFVSYARKQGLGLVPSSVFTVEGEPPQRIRIALGSATNRENLINSLKGIADLMNHKKTFGFESIV